MNATLKKSIASVLLVSICFLFTNPVIASASELSEIQAEIIEVYTNSNGIETTKFDDGVIVEANLNEDEFNILIPAYQSDMENEILSQTGSSIQPRALTWFAVAKVIVDVLGYCALIETYSSTGVNPCKIALDYLFPYKPKGTYIVSAKYVPGRVPGCEPAHSGPCNSGYYEYQLGKL